MEVRGRTPSSKKRPATTENNVQNTSQNDEDKAQHIGIANPSIDEQIFHFADSEPGFSVEFEKPPSNGFDRSKLPEASLAGFLSRPVAIQKFNWGELDPLSAIFNPWDDFFSDPVIKKKIDNYSMLRCNLHVKAVISASPFYYGLAMLSYNPKPQYHPAQALSGALGAVTASQRPKIFISPQNSQGGEIVLPFFHEDVWLRNTSANLVNMGQMQLYGFEVLRTANDITGGNVSITIYAWAENVELSGPTVTVQARKSRVAYKKKKSKKGEVMDKMAKFGSNSDEYGDGPVSGVASAVASAGKALSNVPIIGPFARATEIGAGAASRIAAWFGYTNIPVIDNVAPFKDLPFGGIASSEIAGPTPKLTLDPKNELTLDSRIAGLDGTDELSMKSFLERESFLNTFNWDTVDTPDSPLWTCINVPGGLIHKIDQNSAIIAPTPLSHISHMYQYWSGTIIYRFKVICSPFHRGRIKITFEPAASAVTAHEDTTNITRLYDITENNDFEICVPWMQPQAFLTNHFADPSIGSNLMSYSEDNGAGLPTIFNASKNGVLKVTVANELTSPSINAPVTIAVFVRAGEDFTFMGPRDPPNSLEWVVQSGTTKPEEGDFCDMLGEVDASVDDLNLVYGGESAVSLRQLLHRHCYHRSAHFEGVDAHEYYQSQQHMYPMALNTNDDDRNIHFGTTGKYNFIANTYISWLSPCYAGRRGSTYWAANVVTIDPAKVVFNRMPNFSAGAISPDTYDQLNTTDSPNSSGYSRTGVTDSRFRQSGAGSALYNTSTQAGATVLVPFISSKKFAPTFPNPFFPGFQTLRPGNEGLNFSTNVYEVGGSIVDVDYYTAAGPDFNLLFFAGIPQMRVVETIPPAFGS